MKKQTKDSIKLRTKPISNGNQSLYLDCYYKGKRKYEFLRLYLLAETSRANKDKNRETMRLAEAILAKRLVELRNNEYGFRTSNEDVRFFDYLQNHIDNHTHGNNRLVWDSTARHLHNYEPNGDITFGQIDSDWINGFKHYLTGKITIIGRTATVLSENSRYIYISKLKAIFNKAIKEGVTTDNPCNRVSNFAKIEKERTYLSMEEVRLLANTPCSRESLKRAFLFSCLCGLRYSDVVKLTWGDVRNENGRTRIVFRQKKTGGQEYLDINEQAVQLMGERGNDSEVVFNNLPSVNYNTIILQAWAESAGIHKPITFHTARHTFATMMLSLGTDLYTVSKLLGHKDITTTQIYAKIIDQTKRNAIDKIPDLL